MADTFGQAWRFVRLHVPTAPVQLCQFWVREAYQTLCDKGAWSWLRSESEIIINNQTQGTANVTRNSATVTGVSITFASTDVNRQFRVGSNQPVYTITAVDTGLNTATLDRVYGGTTATAGTCAIVDAYVTMPTDFARFLAVLDPRNNWQLRWWVTEEELNTWDAQRSATGTPRALVSRRLATTTALAGRVQYELWPYATSQSNFPFYYIRRPEDLTDSTTFLGPLAQRGSLLVTGALAAAYEWLAVQQKNPALLPIANTKRSEFESEMARLEVMDQEIYMTWLETVSWINRYPFAPIDAKFMQSHDIVGLVLSPAAFGGN